MELRKWCDEAWLLVGSALDPAPGDLRAQWDPYASRDELVVTLFGPYDSGKSSLLKRLLVEEGLPVPDWLGVSGRRETFEVREASLGWAVVRDTPGLAGGDELHERLTEEALLLCDLIFVVLNPQLVTSEQETFAAVLTGRRFGLNGGAAFATRGLPVLLSRMDEAGAMPDVDPEGYVDLVARKKEELEAFVRAKAGDLDVLWIHAVSADPFGSVGDDVPSSVRDYGGHGSWDGVADVAGYLKEATNRRGDLRLHAETRFLGKALSGAADALGRLEIQSALASDAAVAAVDAHRLQGKRLAALLAAARTDLDRRIEEEVAGATRRGAADAKELRSLVATRLERALSRWAEEHNAGLEELARDIDADLEVRRARPSWKLLDGMLDSIDDASDAGGERKGTRQDLDGLRKAAKAVRGGFQEAQPLVLGMSLQKAREELLALRKAGGVFDKYKEEAGRRASQLADAAHAEQAQRAILIDVGLGSALPAMLEIGGLLMESLSENRAVEARSRRREELRAVVSAASREVGEGAWRLWTQEGAPAGLEKALAVATGSADAVAAALREEVEAASALRARVVGHLAAL